MGTELLLGMKVNGTTCGSGNWLPELYSMGQSLDTWLLCRLLHSQVPGPTGKSTVSWRNVVQNLRRVGLCGRWGVSVPCALLAAFPRGGVYLEPPWREEKRFLPQGGLLPPARWLTQLFPFPGRWPAPHTVAEGTVVLSPPVLSQPPVSFPSPPALEHPSHPVRLTCSTN